MIAIHHLTVSITIGILITTSALIGGFLIDIDHFALKNILTAPKCATILDKTKIPTECQDVNNKGFFHSAGFALMLASFNFAWLAHMFMDMVVVQ